MGRPLLISLVITSWLTASCSAMVTATKPPVSNPLRTASPPPQPTSTLTVEPSISGDFVLTNTSAPGMDVGIETMNIVLEYRLSVEDSWKNAEVNCSFNPPTPTILKDELHVQYTCQYQNQLPADAEVRVTAEVKIFGSDEVFRLLVEAPRP